jgi:hypothetical protein
MIGTVGSFTRDEIPAPAQAPNWPEHARLPPGPGISFTGRARLRPGRTRRNSPERITPSVRSNVRRTAVRPVRRGIDRGDRDPHRGGALRRRPFRPGAVSGGPDIQSGRRMAEGFGNSAPAPRHLWGGDYRGGSLWQIYPGLVDTTAAKTGANRRSAFRPLIFPGATRRRGGSSPGRIDAEDADRGYWAGRSDELQYARGRDRRSRPRRSP